MPKEAPIPRPIPQTSPYTPKLAPSTSAPSIWVLSWLQVVGERCQLPACAYAQPCASFLAFLHVEPWTNASITTSSAHPIPASWGVTPQSHSPGCGTGALTPQGKAAEHREDTVPMSRPDSILELGLALGWEQSIS